MVITYTSSANHDMNPACDFMIIILLDTGNRRNTTTIQNRWRIIMIMNLDLDLKTTTNTGLKILIAMISHSYIHMYIHACTCRCADRTEPT